MATLPTLDEDDSDEDWLVELVTAHRHQNHTSPTAHSPQSSAVAREDDQETSEWLLELLSLQSTPDHSAAPPSTSSPLPPLAATPTSDVGESGRRGVGESVSRDIGRSGSRTSGSREVSIASASSPPVAATSASSPPVAATTTRMSSGSQGVPAATTTRPGSRVLSGQQQPVIIQFPRWSDVGEHLDRSTLQHRGAWYQTWTTPAQDDILTHACLSITLPPPGHVGPWVPLDHVASRLLMWRRLLGVIAFKIGIAADPRDRYWNAAHGYAQDGIWHFMDVLLDGNAQLCRGMEMSLIRAFQGIPGCHNVSPGGEGVRPDRTHRCYVYITVAAAGTGVGLAAATESRRRQQQQRQQRSRSPPACRVLL